MMINKHKQQESRYCNLRHSLLTSPWPADHSHAVAGSAPSFQRLADQPRLVGTPSSAAEAAMHTCPSSALASAGN